MSLSNWSTLAPVSLFLLNKGGMVRKKEDAEVQMEGRRKTGKEEESRARKLPQGHRSSLLKLYWSPNSTAYENLSPSLCACSFASLPPPGSSPMRATRNLYVTRPYAHHANSDTECGASTIGWRHFKHLHVFHHHIMTLFIPPATTAA